MKAKPRLYLAILKYAAAMAACSVTFMIQEGCSPMTTRSVPGDALRFREHAIDVTLFSATQMEVIYGRRLVYRSVFPGSRPEVMREKTQDDERRDLTGGGMLGLRAFEGPLEVKWRSRDGVPHEAVLNLEEIFTDRVVLHQEDPARIDPSLPMQTSGPTIVIEVNNRTLSLYMQVHIYLRSLDANARTREDRFNHTLAYSKTF
ncbi:hypothetical protein [Quatrionicoccus australiensis]|uniref:hypothetical protein n=1 Tax=Quatrionicoccus australiensis TaxID=138118 RepID=UPI001CFC1232|nr:hypothetical protein [Quatrionicoccus australiensis]MCB4359296.1 hypothetical protein [Quatrionicoccus australiensis]